MDRFSKKNTSGLELSLQRKLPEKLGKMNSLTLLSAFYTKNIKFQYRGYAKKLIVLLLIHKYISYQPNYLSVIFCGRTLCGSTIFRV